MQPGALEAGKRVLSEKSVAKDLAQARELIPYKKSYPGLNWCAAENFRSRVCWFITPGWKYYKTPRHKTPEYKNGFLLDGCVHHAAGIRILLSNEKIVNATPFTASNFEHLPLVGTVSTAVKTDKGIVGGFEMSLGTTFEGWEFAVACEDGSEVAVPRREAGGVLEDEVVKKVPNDKNRIGQGVAVFVKAILAGVPDDKQTPELAVEDLEIIRKMLRSGGNDGTVMVIDGGLTGYITRDFRATVLPTRKKLKYSYGGDPEPIIWHEEQPHKNRDTRVTANERRLDCTSKSFPQCIEFTKEHIQNASVTVTSIPPTY
ncbi:hypothetical protein C7212DRAFT_362059 [Tuber magnatum]|uniref:Gfo/Idh/MocA-like oxidoreductase C-terminal domain-containing protein n=1 Tax=Tuber magnatum TaxID=42249 RepID=A0A317T2K1_9PEZI|nr:hypothetical protein C7212DRAFT_362059 [Tuber magnatum]